MSESNRNVSAPTAHVIRPTFNALIQFLSTIIPAPGINRFFVTCHLRGSSSLSLTEPECSKGTLKDLRLTLSCIFSVKSSTVSNLLTLPTLSDRVLSQRIIYQLESRTSIFWPPLQASPNEAQEVRFVFSFQHLLFALQRCVLGYHRCRRLALLEPGIGCGELESGRFALW